MKKNNLFYLILNIILLNFLTSLGEVAYSQEKVKLLSHINLEIDDSETLIGQVQNMLDKKIEQVKVIATFYKEDSSIIGSGSASSDPSTLLPQMKAAFKMNLDQDMIDEIALYDITITWKYPLDDDAQIYQFGGGLNENEDKDDEKEEEND